MVPLILCTTLMRGFLAHVETFEDKKTKYYYNGLGKKIGQVGAEGRIDDIIGEMNEQEEVKNQINAWYYACIETQSYSQDEYIKILSELVVNIKIYSNKNTNTNQKYYTDNFYSFLLKELGRDVEQYQSPFCIAPD